MEMISKAFRGFFNLTASGVLLLIGVGLFIGFVQAPADSSSWKESGPLGALVVLLLGLFSAFLTYGFYRQSGQRSSWVAAFIINAISTVAFFSVVVIWAVHHY
jgi:bacteriorhodopsin